MDVISWHYQIKNKPLLHTSSMYTLLKYVAACGKFSNIFKNLLWCRNNVGATAKMTYNILTLFNTVLWIEAMVAKVMLETI